MRLRIPPALRHRRFRLLWIGLLISLAGSRMQFFALLWHIKQLSDEPIALGAVGLARLLPIISLSPLAGLAADSFDRRKILFVTGTIQIGVAAALSLLTFTESVELWHLYALTAIQAAALSFGNPARQALTPNLVPTKDLQNAFSMQSIAFTTGAIIGPALTGLVLATPGYGQPYTYLFNAVSYLAILGAICLIGPVAQRRDPSVGSRSQIESIKAGVRFIRSQPVILSTMMLDFIATFFSSATALMPIFAADILQVGEVGFGWLSAGQSMGAAVMAVFISQVGELPRQGRLILGAVTVYGAATVAFGLAPTFPLALAALVLIGAADSLSTIIRNTIRQLVTPDEMRGRMTSINQIFFIGGPQLGEVEAGLVAQWFGAPLAVISGGVLCVLSVLGVSWRWPQLRRYQQNPPLGSI